MLACSTLKPESCGPPTIAITSHSKCEALSLDWISMSQNRGSTPHVWLDAMPNISADAKTRHTPILIFISMIRNTSLHEMPLIGCGIFSFPESHLGRFCASNHRSGRNPRERDCTAKCSAQLARCNQNALTDDYLTTRAARIPQKWKAIAGFYSKSMPRRFAYPH
jgi:hypothetical protein